MEERGDLDAHLSSRKQTQCLVQQYEERQQFQARCEAQSGKRHVLRKETKALLSRLTESLKFSLRQDPIVLEPEEHRVNQRLPSIKTPSKPNHLSLMF
jgi:hypothetical protein